VKLGTGLLHVGDGIGAFLFLLHTSEDHLRSRHVGLWVDKELVHVPLTPLNLGLLESTGVLVSGNRSAHLAEDAVKIWAGLGGTTLVHSVALRTLRLEELGALLSVAIRDSDVGLCLHHFLLWFGITRTKNKKEFQLLIKETSRRHDTLLFIN